MSFQHRYIRRAWVLCLLTVWVPLCAGCYAWCLSEAGWVCGPQADFSGEYSVHVVPRNGKPDLVLYSKHPSTESNGKVLLVSHRSSSDSDGAAKVAVVQWGSIFAREGFTVVAHAYREEDSAYGQFDLEDTLDAVDWLNGQGAGLLDVDRVYHLGTSRGGIIAYQVAYRCGPDKLAGVIADRGVSNFLLLEDSYEWYADGPFGDAIQRAVQLTVDWIGVLPNEDPQPWMDLSAAFNIDRIQVPLLVLHGDRDVFVPFEQATDFRDRVLQAGRSDIEFYFVEGRGHLDLGFDPAYRDVLLDFLARH